jgi:hypothetical protein
MASLAETVTLIESQARNLASGDPITRATAREVVRVVIAGYADRTARCGRSGACISFAEAHAGAIVAQRRAALTEGSAA